LFLYQSALRESALTRLGDYQRGRCWVNTKHYAGWVMAVTPAGSVM